MKVTSKGALRSRYNWLSTPPEIFKWTLVGSRRSRMGRTLLSVRAARLHSEGADLSRLFFSSSSSFRRPPLFSLSLPPLWRLESLFSSSLPASEDSESFSLSLRSQKKAPKRTRKTGGGARRYTLGNSPHVRRRRQFAAPQLPLCSLLSEPIALNHAFFPSSLYQTSKTIATGVRPSFLSTFELETLVGLLFRNVERSVKKKEKGNLNLRRPQRPSTFSLSFRSTRQLRLPENLP